MVVLVRNINEKTMALFSSLEFYELCDSLVNNLVCHLRYEEVLYCVCAERQYGKN